MFTYLLPHPLNRNNSTSGRYKDKVDKLQTVINVEPELKKLDNDIHHISDAVSTDQREADIHQTYQLTLLVQTNARQTSIRHIN